MVTSRYLFIYLLCHIYPGVRTPSVRSTVLPGAPAEIKRDSKSFFSYARSKLRTKEQIGPMCDMIDEPKLMAMLLNEFFSSVFTTEDQTNIPSLDCEVELMADITITAAEVQKKLQDLRTDKAPGAILKHPRLLKRTGGRPYRWRTPWPSSSNRALTRPEYHNNGEQLTSSLSSRKGANAIPPCNYTDQSV